MAPQRVRDRRPQADGTGELRVLGLEGVGRGHREGFRCSAWRGEGRGAVAQIDRQDAGVAFEEPTATGLGGVPGDFQSHGKRVLGGENGGAPLGGLNPPKPRGEASKPLVEQVEIVDGQVEENAAVGVGCPTPQPDDLEALGRTDPVSLFQEDVPGGIVPLHKPVLEDFAAMFGVLDQPVSGLEIRGQGFFDEDVQAQVQGPQGEIQMGVVPGGDDRRLRRSGPDKSGQIGVHGARDIGGDRGTAIGVGVQDPDQREVGGSKDGPDVVHAHAARAENQNARR